jgi:hypothetical protein
MTIVKFGDIEADEVRKENKAKLEALKRITLMNEAARKTRDTLTLKKPPKEPT